MEADLEIYGWKVRFTFCVMVLLVEVQCGFAGWLRTRGMKVSRRGDGYIGFKSICWANRWLYWVSSWGGDGGDQRTSTGAKTVLTQDCVMNQNLNVP